MVTKLLDYPMDAQVVVEINGDQEFIIEGTDSIGYSDKRILLKIEVPEEELEE